MTLKVNSNRGISGKMKLKEINKILTEIWSRFKKKLN